ncbi:MAG TPA: DUF2537 domain-containing protein [Pseudonocardiaceae bacterium]
MQLRAERGRAVLVGAPELFRPPTALAGALDEWAEVVEAVCADEEPDPATARLVSARGRQLAGRLAAAVGAPVGYEDPLHGTVEHVEPSPAPRLPLLAAVREALVPEPDPAGRPEPTPWATGLVVSAFAASVVLAALVTLVRGLADVTWLLGALGLIVVTAGLAPSIWLARRTPLWRWVSYGVAGGIVLSWIAVVLAGLGP